MPSSHLILFLLLSIAMVREVRPRSSGAPAEACTDILPLGHLQEGFSSQNVTIIPYLLDLSVFDVDGGQSYEPGMTYISEFNARPGMVPHTHHSRAHIYK